ncbi:MAG: TatD family hydrolase [Planctomycetota bacterium]
MRLVDTHCHLDEEAFASDRDATLARAREAGVAAMLTIGIDRMTSEAAVALAAAHADVFAVVGIQPNYVSAMADGDLAAIEAIATGEHADRVVAIGETGLDRYWDYTPIETQVEPFEWHVDLAVRLGKPFVVHCREAEADILDVLTKAHATHGPLSGVMHSFCGDAAHAAAFVDLGLHVSFSGMLTFKRNAELREVAAAVPRERLLIETDCPYLAPEPYRGKRNEPAYVGKTCEVLAGQHGMTPDEMADLTTRNAAELFGLPGLDGTG